MRCITCGYRLRGLEGKTCPECARKFDPDDPKSYMPDSGPPFPARSALVAVLLGIAGTAIALVFLMGTLGTTWGGAVTAVVAFVFLVLVIIGLPALILTALMWLIQRRQFRD